MSRIANYCAVCGGRLIQQRHSGRDRPFCQACQQPTYFDPKVAVVIFVLRADKVLLIQRAIEPGAGKWALPAGFVDHDEAPEDAAIRETLEETGLHVTIRKLLAVFPKRDDGLADIAIAYGAEITGGGAKAGDDAAAVGFFAAGQLPPLVFYPTITLVAQWRAGELALRA
ncbi:MAG: NUDIX hydrolase [Chloroflexi bacterium]|nr:NUDIX hydrolase [Chloroflexota bacterium]